MQFLRAVEAAEYLRSSTSTLAKLRLTGNGPPFIKIGRAVRYRRDDLDKWMVAHLTKSTSEHPLYETEKAGCDHCR